jgi:hypothetical protein
MEHTRAFFTGRSDVPCSGTVCLDSAVWGGTSATTCRLNGGDTVPHALGG